MMDVDQASGVASPEATITGPDHRITVLTAGLLRLEWRPDGRFVDVPTQRVLNRRFEVPTFTVSDADGRIELRTERLHLSYDRGPFNPSGLTVRLRGRAQGAHFTRWRFGDPVDTDPDRGANLGGTARTLDGVDGACPVEPGLLSRHGYAVIDDSDSLLLGPDGWPRPRGSDGDGEPDGGVDLYFFGYGRDHRTALRDYFGLTGPNPLLPRWALGNWWSRFHPYTGTGYLELFDRFEAEGIPFSVAVLDMDWHLVDIDPTLGTGWTGYTWNDDLLGDEKTLLAALHDRGLAVSLNVHPADGIRRHEAAYPAMARDLGIDPSSGDEIPFDIASRDFVASYLSRLHHPHEDLGVDLWWVDWQSGPASRMPGLDPLWMLNHLHHADSGRDGRRPLTFSRYAGIGSHRYPIGFSGDTVVTWESLAFQPWFTATAANVGYFWWSHDIGGHYGGARDDELTLRWYQFGVFSPINRLHSGSTVFFSKEPWRFEPGVAAAMVRYLRLRHELTPYLYSAMWAAHTDGVGLVRPVYHDHPDEDAAYRATDQYLFGPDLLVAPVTSPADGATGLGRVTAWLPGGDWVDVFDGRRYAGGRTVALHRATDQIPVLARPGTIIPLQAEATDTIVANPERLALRLIDGGPGSTVIVEDDGSALPDRSSRHETGVTVTWRPLGPGVAEVALSIAPPTGTGVLTRREIALDLVGVTAVEDVTLDRGAGPEPVQPTTGPTPSAFGGALRVSLGPLDLTDGVTVRFVRHSRPDAGAAALFELLDRTRMPYRLKDRALDALRRVDPGGRLAELNALDLPGNLFGALVERLDGPGVG